MNQFVDYDLLVKAERIRFQSDFSSAHWLHQLLCKYEVGIKNKKCREAFEFVLRAAINCNCKTAIELAKGYPDIAGFPQFIKLEENNWDVVRKSVIDNFSEHIDNRFKYVREGD